MVEKLRLIRLGSAKRLTQTGGGTKHMEESTPLYWDF